MGIPAAKSDKVNGKEQVQTAKGNKAPSVMDRISVKDRYTILLTACGVLVSIFATILNKDDLFFNVLKYLILFIVLFIVGTTIIHTYRNNMSRQKDTDIIGDPRFMKENDKIIMLLLIIAFVIILLSLIYSVNNTMELVSL